MAHSAFCSLPLLMEDPGFGCQQSSALLVPPNMQISPMMLGLGRGVGANTLFLMAQQGCWGFLGFYKRRMLQWMLCPPCSPQC